MTIIAWDGTTLAADKRMTIACVPYTVTKIFRVRDGIAAVSGDCAQGMDMLKWYENGCDESTFPAAQREKDTWAEFIVVRRDGLWRWERSPQAIRVEDRTYAMGHGRDFALAAMHLGQDAERAARIACMFDTTCGNGIDTLTL